MRTLQFTGRCTKSTSEIRFMNKNTAAKCNQFLQRAYRFGMAHNWKFTRCLVRVYDCRVDNVEVPI